MRHFATPGFWYHHRHLPAEIRTLADRCFRTLEADPRHPSLRFKEIGPYWSARVGRDHRALAVERADGLVWFWIGAHDRYEEKIKS